MQFTHSHRKLFKVARKVFDHVMYVNCVNFLSATEYCQVNMVNIEAVLMCDLHAFIQLFET